MAGSSSVLTESDHLSFLLRPPAGAVQVLQADGGAAVNAAIGNFENVQNFLKAVIRAGLPQDALFSVADLQNDSHEDKPTVVDCLLWLKQQGSQRTSSSSCVSSPVRRQSGASAGAPPLGALLPPSSHPIVPSAERMAQDEQQSQAAATAAARVPSTAPQPPATAAASAGQPAGAPSGSAPLSARSTAAALLAAAGRGSKATAAAGVTDLMQRCTRMLREKSWGSDGNAAAAAAAAQQGGGLSAESSRGDAPNGWCAEEQALATVMQSVMNGVTQSYEQKLLAKDAEAKEHQRKLAAATNRLNELAAHQQALMAELAAARAEAVASAKQESAAVISGLTQQVDGLTAENAALKAEVEAYAGSQDDRVAAVRAELAAVREQLAAAEAEIERLRHFERNYRAVQDENRRLYNQVRRL